ncbi:MAG: polymer-forming cytoskeletal protein [Bacteroidia bacterium]|jgi:cytoskeletal protein CcmA (bactofilin family)
MAVFNNKSEKVPFNPNTLNIVNVGTTITGDLVSDGDMRLDGHVKGYISSKARLVLGPTSKVDGDIKAANLEISGEVNGNIFVSELLTVKSTAKINGDLVTAKMIIEAGAEFNGKCAMKDAGNHFKARPLNEIPSAKSIEATTQKVQ